MANPKINLALQRQIASLTCARHSQKAISVWLNVHRNTVLRYQRRAGLAAWQTIPTKAEEKRILTLLQSGKGRKEVQEITGAAEWAVRRIAEANHTPLVFRRPKAIPAAVLARITADILHRRDYAAVLARKYHLPYERVLQLAHEILGCERLRTGRTRIPLDSPFPQKWPNRFKAKEGE
jgi:hypothetical protein